MVSTVCNRVPFQRRATASPAPNAICLMLAHYAHRAAACSPRGKSALRFHADTLLQIERSSSLQCESAMKLIQDIFFNDIRVSQWHIGVCLTGTTRSQRLGPKCGLRVPTRRHGRNHPATSAGKSRRRDASVMSRFALWASIMVLYESLLRRPCVRSHCHITLIGHNDDLAWIAQCAQMG